MSSAFDTLYNSASTISSSSFLRRVQTYTTQPAAPVSGLFPKRKSIPVSLSEPRDVLQSERTFLTFIRFALSLNFTAIGMILNFRIQTSDTTTSPGNFNDRMFNRAVSFVLVSLSLSTIFISGWNYFRTVRKYSQNRIHTRATSNSLMVICISAAVLTLICVNISLIVESFMQRK